MGTGRKFRKTSMTRPVKSQREKARRLRTQKARLLALGMSEVRVAKMDAKTVRTLLKRPAQIASA